MFALSMLVLAMLPCFPIQKALGEESLQVPILVYHRFGPVVADSMTVTTAVFESQLRYLRDNGYAVIPLRQLVAYRLGKVPPPPPRSVVITADDGHQSVYTHMFPLVKQYRIPVTLFIYPSAISNAAYALSWEQLREMQETGLFEVQSHSSGVGQKLEELVPHLDYISPMLYPSCFHLGIPGYRNPVAHPYEIVYLSLNRARGRTGLASMRFRPWLQAFKDYAFDRRPFTGKEIREQIRAAENFGSHGWMLWNPQNIYSADGLKQEHPFAFPTVPQASPLTLNWPQGEEVESSDVVCY